MAPPILKYQLEEINSLFEFASSLCFEINFDFNNLIGHEKVRILRRIVMGMKLVALDAKALRDRFVFLKKRLPDVIDQQAYQQYVLSKRTFHGFSRLPAELRLMIWNNAIIPPPCDHFFFTHTPGTYPTTVALEDNALWATCKESRYVIQTWYEKQRATVERPNCYCKLRYANEYHSSLARCNKDLRVLWERIDTLDNNIRHELMYYVRAPEYLLPSERDKLRRAISRIYISSTIPRGDDADEVSSLQLQRDLRNRNYLRTTWY